jgi:hypothetical protein
MCYLIASAQYLVFSGSFVDCCCGLLCGHIYAFCCYSCTTSVSHFHDAGFLRFGLSKLDIEAVAVVVCGVHASDDVAAFVLVWCKRPALLEASTCDIALYLL